jgi:putative flippase GtrA
MSDLSSAVQRGAVRLGAFFGVTSLPAGLIRFLGVGLAGLGVQTVIFSLLFRFGADKSLAWLAGMVLATGVTWALNRRFTFGASGRRRRHELLRYMLVTAVAQSVSFAVFHAFLAWAPVIPPPIDVILGAVIATVFSYTGQRFFTFARDGARADADTEPKA